LDGWGSSPEDFLKDWKAMLESFGLPAESWVLRASEAHRDANFGKVGRADEGGVGPRVVMVKCPFSNDVGSASWA